MQFINVSLGGEVVAAEKLAIKTPLRPGVYTISLFIRYKLKPGLAGLNFESFLPVPRSLIKSEPDLAN